MKQILLLALLCLANISIAQSDFTATVYFAKGKHALTAATTVTLDSLAKALNSQKATYEIGLTGHASVEASSDFNQKLSERRVEAVTAYLLQHGIPSFKTTAAEGENKPAEIGDAEQILAKSRRVVLNVHFLAKAVVEKPKRAVEKPIVKGEMVGTADSLRWLLAQLMPEKQVFRINNSRDTLLVGASGTQIFIKAYSFNCGKTIEIRLQEAYQRSEMFFTGLATNSPEGTLQSDGMVNIQAFCGSDKKTIEPAQAITIRMPTEKINTNMNLYTSDNGQQWHIGKDGKDQQGWNVGGCGIDCGGCFMSDDLSRYPIFCKQNWWQRTFTSPIIAWYKKNPRIDRACAKCAKVKTLPANASAQQHRQQDTLVKLIKLSASVEKIVRKHDRRWRKASIFTRKKLHYWTLIACDVDKLERGIALQDQQMIDSLCNADPACRKAKKEKEQLYYVFQAAKLGWKNIDDLYHKYGTVELLVDDTYYDGKLVQVWLKDAKSLVFLQNKNNLYGGSLPGMQALTVIGLQYKNGSPYLALQDGNTKDAKIGEMTYKRMESIATLKRELKKLD